jgi:hypothetical protein
MDLNFVDETLFLSDATGLGNSSVVGPTIVGKLATVFLDTMYKA